MRRLVRLTPCLACLLLPVQQPGATTVDCDAGGTIRAALPSLHPGDTLHVTGTCLENVTIASDVVGVTLNGHGRATIRHPGGATGGARHTVFIRGRAIGITGFTITGGEDGIHLSGPAQAVIDGNIIEGNAGRGVHIDKGSIAQIVSNTIRNNGGIGIQIVEHSYARIGFLIPPEPRLRPNTIQNNGGDGIRVAYGSGAWIVGNTITSQKGSGVVITRDSHADVVANDISGNRDDGIAASFGSGVNLRSEGTARREGPNTTESSSKNGGLGIRCSVGGYVDGPLGTLTGTRGSKSIDKSCIDRVTVR